jgi:hypothetical protein
MPMVRSVRIVCVTRRDHDGPAPRGLGMLARAGI